MLRRDLELEKNWRRISTEQDPYHATYRPINDDYSEEAYYESGRADVRSWLDSYGHHIGRRAHALDIGTGLGRLAFALAEKFDRVTANDITPRYLELIDQRAERIGVKNISTIVYDGDWARPDTYDFILAICVLTQIEDDAHLSSYFENFATCLQPDGVAMMHFDTRPRNAKYYIRRVIPDRVLPVHWRKGFRRIRRDHAALEAMIARSGLQIAERAGVGTEFTYYIAKRAG